jgi:predicted CopG family antitoxin
MDYTTIQIRKETREKLKSARLTRRETYDEVISRLVAKARNRGCEKDE